MTTQCRSAALAACLGACALTLACDSSEGDPEGALSLRQYDCPRWQCGYNTSEVNGKSVQELNLDGQANASGVAMVAFTGPLDPLNLLDWHLDVDGDALVAKVGPSDATPLRGAELIGSVLWLQLDGVMVPVTIADHELVDSWADDSPAVDAYALVYPDLGGLWSLERSVCKGTLIDPLEAAVVILAGERYDPETKAVLPGQDRWLTLACAGSAAAKVALLGYGPHGDLGGGGAVSVERRQATFNMITANYCGDGTAYTADGTPLAWENAGGEVTPFTAPGAFEAVWDENGAVCLDTPRLVDLGEVGCELPACTELATEDELAVQGEWLTHGAELQGGA